MKYIYYSALFLLVSFSMTYIWSTDKLNKTLPERLNEAKTKKDVLSILDNIEKEKDIDKSEIEVIKKKINPIPELTFEDFLYERSPSSFKSNVSLYSEEESSNAQAQSKKQKTKKMIEQINDIFYDKE